MREETPPGSRTAKRPSGPVCGPAIWTGAARWYEGVATTSIVAPAIGAPTGPVRRPRIMWGRPKRAMMRGPFAPFQAALSVACAEALTPEGAPGSHAVGGLATVISRSITGAELPAASITLTTRRCAPFVSFVASRATSALAEAGHGCTYRNAGRPSAAPTSLQR